MLPNRDRSLLWSSLAALLLVSAGGVRAQELDPSQLAERLRVGIEAASTTNDEEGLEEMRALAERALVAFPEDALLNHYMGYALYRIGMSRFEGDPMAAVKTLTESEEFLRASIAIKPIVESHALLTSVLGGQITSNADAMRLGMQVGVEQARASDMGPDNPRVKLMEGVGAYHAPAAFGGGFDVAVKALLAAAELFEIDAPEPPLPAWGHAETFVWLGQAYAALNDHEKAREAYERALALEPNYLWVSEVLLPALDAP